MAIEEQHQTQDQEHGKRYYVDVDGVEIEFDHELVSGGEIMDKAGVPRDVGLIQILDDHTQKPVTVDEVFDLEPGRRFKKRPRFKRG